MLPNRGPGWRAGLGERVEGGVCSSWCCGHVWRAEAAQDTEGGREEARPSGLPGAEAELLSEARMAIELETF